MLFLIALKILKQFSRVVYLHLRQFKPEEDLLCLPCVLAFKLFLNKIACDRVHVRAALERCIKIFIKQNGISSPQEESVNQATRSSLSIQKHYKLFESTGKLSEQDTC